MRPSFLAVTPDSGVPVLKGLASPVRMRILQLLHEAGKLNVNEISKRLSLPQSTVATNIQMLEDAGLVETYPIKAKKGHQKICASKYDEIILRFDAGEEQRRNEPDRSGDAARAVHELRRQRSLRPVLDRRRHRLARRAATSSLIRAGSRLRSCGSDAGTSNTSFPTTPSSQFAIEAVEFSMELSSEVPGTNLDWPSDITLWVNDHCIGTWTSPGDFGDKRGVYTPGWWKLEGSQYGKLKTWRINKSGSFIDGVSISNVTVDDIGLSEHHSIRMRIGIDENAHHPGGVNIFGRGFGNYDQDIVMRLHLDTITGATRLPSFRGAEAHDRP